MKKTQDYHYSREGSKKFWKRVGAVNQSGFEDEWMRLYRMGCVLQNIEELVMEELIRAEQKAK
jgi:hypothetical protein